MSIKEMVEDPDGSKARRTLLITRLARQLRSGGAIFQAVDVETLYGAYKSDVAAFIQDADAAGMRVVQESAALWHVYLKDDADRGVEA